MCRMLAVVSREPIALDAAIAREIEPFTEQSRLHADGWGVAWYGTPEVEDAVPRNAAEPAAEPAPAAVAASLPDPLPVRRTPRIRRRIGPAWEDDAYRAALAEAVGPMMLVHLRKASPGLPLQPTNTHPFREGEMVFAHNGQFDLPDGLREVILARGGRMPDGTTDSELLFSLIERELQEAGVDPATAVQRAAAELTSLLLEHGARVPESLNCFLMSPDQLIAYQQSDPSQAKPYHESDNYTLRWSAEEDRVIIATSGIPEDSWHELADGQALIIRREDRSVELRQPLA